MAFDVFLKFEPAIEGESRATGFEKQIEIYSFGWGAANPVSLSSSGGSALSAGKASVSSFSFMKKLDKASCTLFQNCCTGKNMAKAIITLRKAGGDGGQQPFLEYVLETVMVESVNWTGSSGGDDTPMESVTLAFSKISMTYSQMDKDGKMTKAGQAAWDLATVSAK